jgi:hypothetical protein
MGTPVPVTSSNVRSFTYDDRKRELIIEFGSGSYRYNNVDLDTVLGLYNANSKGAYIHQHIKGKFVHAKL